MVKKIKNKTIFVMIVLFVISFVQVSYIVQAQEHPIGAQDPSDKSQEQGPQGGGPPEEAITSCDGKSLGDTCSFETTRETITGTCGTTPDGFACMPTEALQAPTISNAASGGERSQEAVEAAGVEPKGFFRRAFAFLFGWIKLGTNKNVVDERENEIEDLREDVGKSVETVALSGGHETDAVDGGRPVYLIGAMLGITGEQFREAFSYVTPEDEGHLNTETAQANKQALLAQLEQYGITNDEIDEATNYYRYPPGSTEIWPYTDAVLTAKVEDGKVTGFEIISGGNGYTSEPTITVEGYGEIATVITISYTDTFLTNGAITAITVIGYSEANDVVTTTPDGIPNYLKDVWDCIDSDITVSDLTTGGDDSLKCSVEVTYTDTEVIIRSNAIPPHDFESTLGCCATEQNSVWTIPLYPTEDRDGDYTMAPERGPVGFTVAGVALYGPEEGPGGDAVALEHAYFTEDRQEIDIGLCGGHAGPGGEYHHHFDANCLHWHSPEEDIDWTEYEFDDLLGEEHSDLIGFGLDGYPIYGSFGWDNDEHNGEVREMLSSYRLKSSGGQGYNGIDDWEYVEGLGDLDECNGHFAPTPHNPEGFYHYHSTVKNGDGAIGFPYFLLCYHGVYSESNLRDSGQDSGGGPPGGGPPGFG